VQNDPKFTLKFGTNPQLVAFPIGKNTIRAIWADAPGFAWTPDPKTLPCTYEVKEQVSLLDALGAPINDSTDNLDFEIVVTAKNITWKINVATGWETLALLQNPPSPNVSPVAQHP
jgi:hypothetical protein